MSANDFSVTPSPLIATRGPGAQLHLVEDGGDDVPVALAGHSGVELVGTDLYDLPRTAAITVAELGAAAAAMVASIEVHTASSARASGEREVRIRELNRMLLVLNDIGGNHCGSGSVSVPPALLTRSARCLDLAGDAAADGDRAVMLHRAASALRSRGID